LNQDYPVCWLEAFWIHALKSRTLWQALHLSECLYDKLIYGAELDWVHQRQQTRSARYTKPMNGRGDQQALLNVALRKREESLLDREELINPAVLGVLRQTAPSGRQAVRRRVLPSEVLIEQEIVPALCVEFSNPLKVKRFELANQFDICGFDEAHVTLKRLVPRMRIAGVPKLVNRHGMSQYD